MADTIKKSNEKQIVLKIGSILEKPSYLINKFMVVDIDDKPHWLGIRYTVASIDDMFCIQETVWSSDLEKSNSMFKVIKI